MLYRLAIALLLLLLEPPFAQSFIGNIKIGGFQLPCAIACGPGRGIVNPRFAGDAVNSFLSRPSIDAFHNAMDQSVDRGIAALDGVLSKQRKEFLDELQAATTEQREKLFEELTGLTDEALTTLDNILTKKISELNDVIKTQLGSLDAILIRQVNSLSTSLSKVIVLGLVLSGLVFLVWRTYSQVSDGKPLRQMLRPFVWGVALLLAFGAIGEGITYWIAQRSEAQVVDQFLRQYNTSIEDLDLPKAAYLANQLSVFDNTDRVASGRALKAAIMRDIFIRPSLYRTPDGIKEAMERVSSAQFEYLNSKNHRLDHDLTILYGFLTWQGGNDRFSEYIAACIFASALSGSVAQRSREEVLLLPFAEYYIRAYLANPLPDNVVASLLREHGESFGPVSGNSSDPGKASLLLPRYFTVADLQSSVNKVHTDVENLGKKNSFYAHARIGLRTVHVQLQVISNYVEYVRVAGLLI